MKNSYNLLDCQDQSKETFLNVKNSHKEVRIRCK